MKLRVILWRNKRCLKPCDRLSSLPSVTPVHLIVGANEMSHDYHYGLRAEVKSDSIESRKMLEAL